MLFIHAPYQKIPPASIIHDGKWFSKERMSDIIIPMSRKEGHHDKRTKRPAQSGQPQRLSG
jgi:hypothetical protein